MVEVPDRRARFGSVRSPMSMLLVQFRGKRLQFGLASTAFTVVLLSELNAMEAHLYQKVLLQRVVDNQPELLQQRPLSKSDISFYDARYKAHQKKSVKCVYLTEWPPHAYCHVLSPSCHKMWSEVEKDCSNIKMSVLSMATTPMYRICRLIRLFGIEDHRIWVEDIMYQPDTISWEDCSFRTENTTKPPAECHTCNVSVICQAGYYYSYGPRCAKATYGERVVEYCYENEKVNAADALKRCTQKHSSAIVHTFRTNEKISYLLFSLLGFSREYWVNLKAEDIRTTIHEFSLKEVHFHEKANAETIPMPNEVNLSKHSGNVMTAVSLPQRLHVMSDNESELNGVISINFNEIDWNSACATVWIGGVVPWFFVRNCSDFYRVLCESIDSPECAPDSYNYERCSAGRGTFNNTSASEICAKRNHSLLSGKPFYSFHPMPKPKPNNYWDAAADTNWDVYVKSCVAVNFDFPTGVLDLIRQNCSKKLGYICEKSKPRVSLGFDCENDWNSVQSTLRPVCVRNVASNYPESIEECGKLGMELIPIGLEHLEYMNIVNNYFLRYMVQRPRSALWVNIPHRVKDSCPIMFDWKNFTFDYADCTQNIGSTLCLFTNKERRSAADATTN